MKLIARLAALLLPIAIGGAAHAQTTISGTVAPYASGGQVPDVRVTELTDPTVSAIVSPSGQFTIVIPATMTRFSLLARAPGYVDSISQEYDLSARNVGLSIVPRAKYAQMIASLPGFNATSGLILASTNNGYYYSRNLCTYLGTRQGSIVGAAAQVMYTGDVTYTPQSTPPMVDPAYSETAWLYNIGQGRWQPTFGQPALAFTNASLLQQANASCSMVGPPGSTGYAKTRPGAVTFMTLDTNGSLVF